MHPWLEDLSFFTFYLVFDTEEKCITFFTDIELIVSKNSPAPDCPSCNVPMCVKERADAEFGWEWVCKNAEDNITDSEEKCDVTVNPAENTLFEDKKISFQDILILLYFFVVKQPINSVIAEMCRTKQYFGKPIIPKEVIYEYFAIFREVCEVHASYFIQCLGGSGRSGRFDKVFLAKRTYHYDKVFGQDPIVVLGIFCKEGKDEKEGVFLEFDAPEKPDLLPIIYKYYHPDTRIIPFNQDQILELKSNDSPKKSKRRRIANDEHSKSPEEELLYKHIECTASKQLSNLQQYMAWSAYRKCRFSNKSACEQVQTFLLDVRSVYPGPTTQGLRLRTVSDVVSSLNPSDKAETSSSSASKDIFDFYIKESKFDW